MEPVIKVENVSIKYRVGDFSDIGLKEYVLKKIQGKISVKEFWAVRDVSFSLDEGDMLGIIGTNGAGKSTLLKAIAGIIRPTVGEVSVKGKIAALLELTAGFDNDLTVRENIFLRGALLGYSKKFIEDKYAEIITFSELEEFEDRPFKQLSSGMKSRLAFSIACLVNPEILILDEVLSVGDGSFRKKSSQKMRSVMAEGVTGILVSHSIDQIKEVCTKVLWLDKGKQITFSGDTETICDAYIEFLENKVLPENEEDMSAMAEEYRNKQQEIMQKKIESKIEKIQKEIERGTSEESLEAALRIIRKKRPDLLKESLRGENGKISN